MILADSDNLDKDVLPYQIKESDGTAAFNLGDALFTDDSPIIPFEKLKEEAIRHSLRVTGGNIVDAAKKLHVGRATFYRLMDKYNIDSKKK